MRSPHTGGSYTMRPSNLEAIIIKDEIPLCWRQLHNEFSNLETCGSFCRSVLCDDGHEMSSFPKLGYQRVVKIKDICRHPRDGDM